LQGADQDDEGMMELSQSQEPIESIDMDNDTIHDETPSANLPEPEDMPRADVGGDMDHGFDFGFGEDELYDFDPPSDDYGVSDSQQLLAEDDEDDENDLGFADDSSPGSEDTHLSSGSIDEFSDEDNNELLTPPEDTVHDPRNWLGLEADRECMTFDSCDISLHDHYDDLSADFLDDGDWEGMEDSSEILLDTLSYSYDSEMLVC
jgi:hypothetical protein